MTPTSSFWFSLASTGTIAAALLHSHFHIQFGIFVVQSGNMQIFIYDLDLVGFLNVGRSHHSFALNL